jgi:hypothetical protein
MKETLATVQLYSPARRRAEKARQRRRDCDLAAAGSAQAVQAANRLISNPKEWRLVAPEDLPNE